MKIKLVEIQNFRKLKSVRIDLADKTTVFVGANNSGKTSGMIALRRFLVTPKDFTVRDFTLSHWSRIDAIGVEWLASADTEAETNLNASQWMELCPSIDVWLEASVGEVHLVRHLIPTLDWAGGALGVRLQFVPEDLEGLYRDFVTSARNARDIRAEAQGAVEGALENFNLWPTSLSDYLERDRRLQRHFELQAFLLDPAKLEGPDRGVAKPQAIPDQSEKLEGSPFDSLILIHDVDAQRGLSDNGGTDDSRGAAHRKRLSVQLREYYQKHLDPTEAPEPEDLEAMHALQSAQGQFDVNLRERFSPALKELEQLGYPGITDPKVTITSQIRPAESLDHDSAVQYDLIRSNNGNAGDGLRLPEQYIGLGYQNLISLVFRLMSFRDAWMQVGKASKTSADVGLNEYSPPPIHLVMVEEPEAHLHAQVQRLFILKAYSVLRNHPELGAKTQLSTQLVVSTHSSHIAHETDFSSLRYFRRLPAGIGAEVPVSSVINLSEVFGPDKSTPHFVSRYLKTTHCDLFFADAAILIEGAAERLLVPFFIKKDYPDLHSRYVTLLEIGGSHAHRLRPLIEHLHIPTLVVTDLDPARNEAHWPVDSAKRGAGMITRNPVLRRWIPRISDLGTLLDLRLSGKVLTHDDLFSVCVAYQRPVEIKLDDEGDATEVIAATFEDALVFDNLELFRTLTGKGLIKKFREAINLSTNAAELSEKLSDALDGGQKAGFALDLLYHDEAENLRPPTYIRDGLSWLQDHLNRTNMEILVQNQASAVEGEPAEVEDVGD